MSGLSSFDGHKLIRGLKDQYSFKTRRNTRWYLPLTSHDFKIALQDFDLDSRMNPSKGEDDMNRPSPKFLIRFYLIIVM